MPLRRLTARNRSEATNWSLAAILALTAGVVDVSGYMALRQYTSHMSGLIADLSWKMTLAGFRSVSVPAVVLASFLAGAVVCAIAINWLRRLQWESQYAVPVLIEAVLLAAAAWICSPLRVFTTVAILAFTMGLQNAIITKISNKEIRTTHVTGTITDIGIQIGRALYWNRSDRGEPVRADVPHLLLLTLLVVLFFTGGVLSAWSFPHTGFHLLLPFAIFLALLTILPIRADLHRIS
jgi:uncharacterized membrane protein YoaK (UPF0700 family)